MTVTLDPSIRDLHTQINREETDRKFLRSAKAWADIWSKDPSTKVGAVAVGVQRNQVAFGYNGLPPGLVDTPERLNNRDQKLALTLHAESNALANATFPAHTLYITHPPCQDCALRILQARTVQRVVYAYPGTEFLARWGDVTRAAGELLAEGGVAVEMVVMDDKPAVVGELRWVWEPALVFDDFSHGLNDHILQIDGVDYARVRGTTKGHDSPRWWWSTCDVRILSMDTFHKKVDTAEEAKAQAMTYVRKQLGLADE